MHLLYSYLALASFFLLCPPYLFCLLLILFCFPVISSYYHLILPHNWCILEHQLLIRYLSIYHFFSLFLPCSIPGLSFPQFLILFTFSMFCFGTLLSYTSPPPSFTSLIVTISSLILSSTHLSTLFLTF